VPYGWERDSYDERIAAPEVVTRQNVRCEETKDHIENCGPEAGRHRKLEREHGLGLHQRRPELIQSTAGAKDEDGSERKKDERQHHEEEHADAEWSSNVETTHVPHCWSDTTHMGLGSLVFGLWPWV
jgi:hypothetical protein